MEHLFSQIPERLARGLNWPEDYLDTIRKQTYHRFTVPKKDGTPRPVVAPGPKLKFLQNTLGNALQLHYLEFIPDCVHGYVPGIHPKVGVRHILSNARTHLPNTHLLNLDIDDFFPNVDSLRLMDTFRRWFPEMPQVTQELLVALCTHKNQLPMGAPSSPVLANMILYPLDQAIGELCAKHGITFTRYVDDMSFSADSDVVLTQEAAIREIVAAHDFTINEKKRKYFSPEEPKQVTGLILHHGAVMVARELLDNMGRCIREYEKLRWLSEHLEQDKKWLKYKVRHTSQSIEGQLAFLQQIEGAEDPDYLRLRQKFEKAKTRRPPSFDFYF